MCHLKAVWLRISLVLAFCVFNTICFGEILSVPFEGGTIPTAAWMSGKPKAVLIFVPGGNGKFDIASRNPAKPIWILSQIAEQGIDVVLMDSEESLGERDLSPRRTSAHVRKIAAVAQFYRKKAGRPVFLLGHSNGAVSIAEFLNQSPGHQKLIAGAIFSGSRNETELAAKVNLSVLIMHHQEDPNMYTKPEYAEQLFLNVKRLNGAKTTYSLVHGGFNEGNPATSGRHMYAGSHAEAARIVSGFILSAAR